jgi:hypothetical protein
MLTWVLPPEPDDDTLSGFPALPQRVREASLRPDFPPPGQPRAQGVTAARNPMEGGAERSPMESRAERSPMESGALLASLQQGWQRGRAEAEQAQAERAEDG